MDFFDRFFQGLNDRKMEKFWASFRLSMELGQSAYLRGDRIAASRHFNEARQMALKYGLTGTATDLENRMKEFGL